MSDEPIAQPQAGAEPEASQVEQPAVEADEFDKERALATISKLREFEKESKRLAKRVSEYEEAEQRRKEAEMSETDKLKAQLDKATGELRTLQINELKRQAAATHNIPEALALRLQGNTPEEIEADAKEFAKTLPKIPERPKISATNPGQVPSQSREQQVKELLWGQHQGRSIFDPDYVAAHGGGVFEVTKNEE